MDFSSDGNNDHLGPDLKPTEVSGESQDRVCNVTEHHNTIFSKAYNP